MYKRQQYNTAKLSQPEPSMAALIHRNTAREKSCKCLQRFYPRILNRRTVAVVCNLIVVDPEAFRRSPSHIRIQSFSFSLGLSHTGGDLRYGGKRRRQATAQAERQLHTANVCTRTLATHVHSSSARSVPYMAQPRHPGTNRHNGFIHRVFRLRR